MGARASRTAASKSDAPGPRLLGNEVQNQKEAATKVDIIIPPNTLTMKAFGIRVGGEIGVIEELELPVPELRPRDLLVRVEAVALNPVDTKMRSRETPPGGFPKVLGWDGSGVVEALGAEVTGFQAGDRVFFAGSLIRNGSNADLVAVDERIVARAPSSITAAVAASVPLVALTAWEGLESLGVDPAQIESGRQRTLLVIPGAGGVGSYVIQLAKAAGLRVIATASREESREACTAIGADFVINHREPLKPQLEQLGINGVHFIFDAVDFAGYAKQFSEIIQPFGKIVSISDSITDIAGSDLQPFRMKSVGILPELMFTRSMFEAPDMGHQGEILAMTAQMIDEKRLQTPIWKSLPWSLESLHQAHKLQESGKAIGKIVMSRE
jgi:zinc-binding alcohol dehydrogenase family protein